MNPAPHQTRLIALDWGTSSLRAYRLGAEGQRLELRALPWGVMQLPDAGSAENAGFEAAFEQACGDWLQAAPGTPVIAAGMVGSRQGWCEAPYLEVPLAVSQIGGSLASLHNRHGQLIHIVPGLMENSQLPNVMRGEETQVVGVLSLHAQQGKAADILIGLPGTHSKWVQIRHAETQNEVRHFDTFMTGEVYAALCGHTILGRGMVASDNDTGDDAQRSFERGLQVAQTAAGQAGVLSTIFSTRTLGLTGELDGTGQREYLSGLLIGHEIAALHGMLQTQQRLPAQVMLVGEAGLCERYAQALRTYGFGKIEVVQQATERGLWQLALSAGLLHT
ncbi:2-dehydro-3-deoxygalactonokinase [Collimonas sp. PA-H2]|uniref:2-dehydro-3-deoxygalactonokinase n=1 Tax=Collimonas sp. PA-H2 TaxID=1881062 RepID=UPI000BF3538D|nr:2-dehydro-3-deoxygalactonokinase [Collimonas sp. PA-H2]PFH09230.1 2-dehydro-3-deoxygalactonokinase [Collimonas sp. PA-H2]